MPSFTNTVTSQTLNLDLSSVGAKKETLSTLCTDLFLIVIKMREAEDLGDVESLRKLIAHYVNQFARNCRSMKVPHETTQTAQYAVVALLDETVLSIPGPCRDFWITNPMQLELFGDNLAGQEFYTKLNTLMTEPEKNNEVLEVYYLCLSLGFMGKYKLGNAEEREKIINTVARELVQTRKHETSGLSPHGRPALRLNQRKGSGVRFPLWAAGAVAAGATFVVWAAMWIISGTSAGGVGG